MIFDKPIIITDALKNMLLKKVLALSPDIGTESDPVVSARTITINGQAGTQRDKQNINPVNTVSQAGVPIYFGWSANASWYGPYYIDEFRLSNIARWTNSFTPPIAAYLP